MYDHAVDGEVRQGVGTEVGAHLIDVPWRRRSAQRASGGRCRKRSHRIGAGTKVRMCTRLPRTRGILTSALALPRVESSMTTGACAIIAQRVEA